MNLMADMIFGGPAKVTNNPLLVALVGSIQGGLVLVPLLFPIIMVWQRGSRQNPHKERYPIEHVAIIGKIEHTQNTIFVIGMMLIILASVNNAVYIILGARKNKRSLFFFFSVSLNGFLMVKNIDGLRRLRTTRYKGKL